MKILRMIAVVSLALTVLSVGFQNRIALVVNGRFRAEIVALGSTSKPTVPISFRTVALVREKGTIVGTIEGSLGGPNFYCPLTGQQQKNRLGVLWAGFYNFLAIYWLTLAIVWVVYKRHIKRALMRTLTKDTND